jgi:hypothetical protein
MMNKKITAKTEFIRKIMGIFLPEKVFEKRQCARLAIVVK